MSAIDREIERLEALLHSLKSQQSKLNKPVREVTEWDFGAQVRYQDGTVENISIPPKVGRFPVWAYNQIIQAINKNSQAISLAIR